jgi:uncharacterized phage protein gp47/JayE
MASFLDPSTTSFSAVVERLLESMGPTMDTTPGSVVRTLSEAYAREMAVFYGMLALAHRSGYIDTAQGAALDNVVAILGVKRARGGRLTGQVEFSRAVAAAADIGIPAGRTVTGTTADGKPLPSFETVEDTAIRAGETRVLVGVQEVQDDAVPPDPNLTVINPGTLIVMPRSLLGVEAVTNLEPIRRTTQDETDDQLRARAKNALHDQGQGTLNAIAAAVRGQGVHDVTVRETAGGPAGIVEVVIGDPDVSGNAATIARIEAAVRAAKSAGIRVNLSYSQSVLLQPTFQVEPSDPTLDDRGFDRLRQTIAQALADFAAALPAGTTVGRRKLEAVLFGNAAVQNVTEIQMKTFTLSDLDHPEAASREVGPDRDWKMGPLETPVIDLDKKPPNIERFVPPIYQLNLVVTVETGDGRSSDVLRGDVTAAVGSFGDSLFDGNKSTLKFAELQAWLVGHARLTGLSTADVVTERTGLSTALKAGDVVMEDSWRLTVGRVDIVGAP